jgi:integrase/recombinase XerD
VNEPALFLNDHGGPFRDSKLGDRVKRYLKNAGIQAPGSCHLLRHAMATHMLENGAELRFIQAMLGHGDYRATQVYTHVSIRKLQEIHAATHPARLPEDEEPTADQVLAQLAAEASEED